MSRPTRSREVRAARHAKDLAKWFGHGTDLHATDEEAIEEAEIGFEVLEADERRPLDHGSSGQAV